MIPMTGDIQAPHVLDFCQSVVAGATPVQVACAPDPEAVELDCFATVDKRVQTEGGQRVLGWAVWEVPGLFIEAEFHAVWARPSDGALLNIAQHQAPFAAITFVADPLRQYVGRQVDNVRRPLCDDPRVRQFIHFARRRFEILNAGARADMHELILPSRERKEYEAVMAQLGKLSKRLFG